MATFSFIPNFAIALTKKPRLLEARFGEGYSQITNDGINNNPEGWQLSFVGLTDAEADAIEDFIDENVGMPIEWTPPRKTQKKYICREFSRTHQEEESNEIKITLEQFYG